MNYKLEETMIKENNIITHVKTLEDMITNIINNCSPPKDELGISHPTSGTWNVKSAVIHAAKSYLDNHSIKEIVNKELISTQEVPRQLYDPENPYCDLPELYKLKIINYPKTLPFYHRNLIDVGNAVGNNFSA